MDKGIIQFPKHGPVDQTAQDKGVFHFLDGDDVRQASRLFPCPNHGFPNGPGLRFKLLPGPVPASPGTEFRIRFTGAAVGPVEEILKVPAHDSQGIGREMTAE